MEMQVIKSKSTNELQEHEEQLRAQLFALRIQKAIGKLDAPHMISQLRKDIARIKTELQSRSLKGEDIKPINIKKMTLPEPEVKKESKSSKKEEKKTLKKNKKLEKETNKEDVEKKDPSNPENKKITTDSTPKEGNNNDK
ncbi:MAG: 50S ribosomal protein L29 [Spiroplasma sp.]